MIDESVDKQLPSQDGEKSQGWGNTYRRRRQETKKTREELLAKGRAAMAAEQSANSSSTVAKTIETDSKDEEKAALLRRELTAQTTTQRPDMAVLPVVRTESLPPVKIVLPANGSVERSLDSSRTDVAEAIREIVDPIKLGYIHEAQASLDDKTAEKVGMFGSRRIARWPKPHEVQDVTIGKSRIRQNNALTFTMGKSEPFNEDTVRELDSLDSSIADSDPRSKTQNPANIHLQFGDGISTIGTAWSGPLAIMDDYGDHLFGRDDKIHKHFLLRKGEGHDLLTKFIQENLITSLCADRSHGTSYYNGQFATNPEWFKNASVQVALGDTPRIIVDQNVMMGNRYGKKVKLEEIDLHSEWVYDPTEHQFVFSFGKQGDSPEERQTMEKRYAYIYPYFAVRNRPQENKYIPHDLREEEGLQLITQMLDVLPHTEA